jgi:hypothetical protein
VTRELPIKSKVLEWISSAGCGAALAAVSVAAKASHNRSHWRDFMR